MNMNVNGGVGNFAPVGNEATQGGAQIQGGQQFQDSLKTKSNEDVIKMMAQPNLGPQAQQDVLKELVSRLENQGAEGGGGAKGAGGASEAGGGEGSEEDELKKLLKKLKDGSITMEEMEKLLGMLKGGAAGGGGQEAGGGGITGG